MKRLLYVAAAWLALPSAARADTVGDCHIGAYRLSDGSVVDIGPTGDADLRWRRFDGTTGALRRAADGSWISLLGGTDRPDGKRAILPGCPAGEIRFDQRDGRRIAFDGERVSIRVADGYYALIRDFARDGRITSPGPRREPRR
jgi:hypothetical protein